MSALGPDQQFTGSVSAVFEKGRGAGSIGVDILKAFRSLYWDVENQRSMLRGLGFRGRHT